MTYKKIFQSVRKILIDFEKLQKILADSKTMKTIVNRYVAKFDLGDGGKK